MSVARAWQDFDPAIRVAACSLAPSSMMADPLGHLDCPPSPRYSSVYWDDEYEYRHVVMDRETTMYMLLDCMIDGTMYGRKRLLNESEWRSLGLCMSPGWVHYENHNREPHVLLFRRPHFGGRVCPMPVSPRRRSRNQRSTTQPVMKTTQPVVKEAPLSTCKRKRGRRSSSTAYPVMNESARKSRGGKGKAGRGKAPRKQANKDRSNGGGNGKAGRRSPGQKLSNGGGKGKGERSQPGQKR